MRRSPVLAVAVLTFTALLGTVPAHAATTRLEAESAALSGGAVVETDHPGYSGSGFVGGFTDGHRGTARTTFAVSAASAGSYTLALGYANGTGSSRTLTLTVDSLAQQVSLPATASWDSWGSASVAVSLGAGAHSVSYTFGSGDSGNVNLDRLDVTPSATGQAGPLFEAENATLSGGAVVATDHPGYSGSGFVGGYTDSNKGNARTSFAVKVTTAGPQSLALRYANGTGTAMTLSLYVDSVRQRQVSLPASANWDTWTSATESVTLTAGDHTVAYAFDSTDSGNVNLDSLTVTASVPAGPGEAEAAFLSGGATIGATTAGYTGPGYVTGFATAGARLVRTFAMASAGTATATIRFANAGTLAVSANGRDAGTATLPSGTGWRTATVSVPVRAGVNTLQLAGTGSDVQVDSVVVANETALAARGATTPYTEYEAEAGTTTGTVLAADRTFHTVQAESSGRRAVRLGSTGQSVSFTLTKPANAVTLRFSIPDTADGAGQTAPLALYANGTKVRDLSLTSNYSWVYGAYPYTNVPSQGSPHRYYDETRASIGDWPAGTVLKLQKDASSTAAYYDVDLLDAEQAPAAATAPAGALSITSYGAVPDNGSDATSAINAAIAAGASQNKPVWIPAGTFRITSKINVANVRVFGAGPWSSVIQGTGPRGGFFGTGSNVTLADFAIFGDVRVRDDNGSDGALDGNFGTGSLIQNLWIEHTKVGLWADSGTNGLYVVGTRIRDTFADGVNIHAKDAGTSNVRVDQSMVRNTGDDGLAMFSEGNTVAGSAYTFNTVQSPALANGIGVFGGAGNRIEDNVVSDNVEAGSGITVGTRFNPVPLSGTTSIRRNTLVRTGSFEHNWNSAIGGLWIYADSAPIAAPIVVEDLTLTDSTYQGVLLSFQKSITQLSFDRMTIAGAGTYGLETNATGSASIAHTSVTGATSGGLLNDGGYTLVRGAGNSGF
ncbi:carbohydrate-binding protein [Amycolatopsis sp. NPDC048633]|uniref:carbohydrate-binding protein n=1 Tax=Amycolatopsis sp. NPDC048633 TaxID=3157095 RepID=UPI0033EA8AF9